MVHVDGIGRNEFVGTSNATNYVKAHGAAGAKVNAFIPISHNGIDAETYCA